jgi:hypothetical protein
VGLRKEDAELLVSLFRKERKDIYIDTLDPPGCLRLPCCLRHLGPAQLSPSATSVSPNLYELANGGHAVVYIEQKRQKEGSRHFAVHPDVRKTPGKG